MSRRDLAVGVRSVDAARRIAGIICGAMATLIIASTASASVIAVDTTSKKEK